MINPYETPGFASTDDEGSLAGVQFPVFQHVVITPAILTKAHFAAHGTGSGVLRFASAIMACISTCFTIGMGWSMLNDRFPLRGAPVLAIFGFTAVLFWLWAISGKRMLRTTLERHFAKRSQLLGSVVYELTRSQIIVHNGGDGYRVAWSQILGWRQYEEVIIAFQTRTRYLIIPTSLFGAEANDVVWRMLGE